MPVTIFIPDYMNIIESSFEKINFYIDGFLGLDMKMFEEYLLLFLILDEDCGMIFVHPLCS